MVFFFGRYSPLAPLLIHHTASPVIQTLLDALAAQQPAMCTDLCRAIAEPSGDGEAASASAPFARLMQDRVGSHLAEKVIDCILS